MSSNPWQAKTNAMLFHAEHFLALAAAHDQGDGSGAVTSVAAVSDNVSSLALREDSCELALSLILYEALRVWVNELQVYIDPSAPELSNLESVWAVTTEDQPEWQYLINLKQDPYSWLNVILSQATRPASVLAKFEGQKVSAAQAAAQQEAAEASGMISIAQLATKPKTLQTMTRAELLGAFKSYIKEVRARQAYW